jgi:hypothetical protein
MALCGLKIADGVNFYIAAGSKLEQIAAEAAGDWQALIEAGLQPLPPACGPAQVTGISSASFVGQSQTEPCMAAAYLGSTIFAHYIFGYKYIRLVLRRLQCQ